MLQGSSAPNAVEAVAEVANASAYTPFTLSFENMIESVHSFTGLNWWVSIAVATLFLRGLSIPLLIQELKTSTNYRLTLLQREEKQMLTEGTEAQEIEDDKRKAPQKDPFVAAGATHPEDPSVGSWGDYLLRDFSCCNFSWIS